MEQRAGHGGAHVDDIVGEPARQVLEPAALEELAPAGLNYGDTFSYALARRMGVPLLFVGEDFAQTDVLVA